MVELPMAALPAPLAAPLAALDALLPLVPPPLHAVIRMPSAVALAAMAHPLVVIAVWTSAPTVPVPQSFCRPAT